MRTCITLSTGGALRTCITLCSGGAVRETDDRAEAMEGAHVGYAKSWQAPAAYGEVEAEARLREG